MPPPLILASTSAYRKALLERLRFPFTVVAPNVVEKSLAGESAESTALRLAELKAISMSASYPNALIIGSDQVAELDGLQLGKPGGHLAARRQLQTVRGKRVTFHTALCLHNTASGRVQLHNTPTTVVFRDFTDKQIERYLGQEQPYDCAGSAKIEGMGIALVERVASDDPTALIGLPLIRLVSMLENEGIAVIPAGGE